MANEISSKQRFNDSIKSMVDKFSSEFETLASAPDRIVSIKNEEGEYEDVKIPNM